MNTVKIEGLTAEKFSTFGYFAQQIDPQTEKIGAAPVEFYRDMLQLPLGSGGLASFSTCRVEKRPLVIDVTEYHNTTGEGILPIDNDILIHVAPATPEGIVPLDKVRVFRVPKGTMVALKPGVWHHAPFSDNDLPANVLIVLPERTYANDCKVVELAENEKIQIVG